MCLNLGMALGLELLVAFAEMLRQLFDDLELASSTEVERTES
jgi:hypothetical protein